VTYPIQNVNNKSEAKFLRSKTEPFDFKKSNKRDISEFIKNMQETMRQSSGIGLAANQIGLNMRVFVAEVPSKDGGAKFYAIFNPTIQKIGEETSLMEEGCLSVPGIFGEVKRAERVVLSYEDKNGKPQKIKAWGLLARVFQHEMDHLEGRLILDTAERILKEDEK
jgi:peptide deformylase